MSITFKAMYVPSVSEADQLSNQVQSMSDPPGELVNRDIEANQTIEVECRIEKGTFFVEHPSAKRAGVPIAILLQCPETMTSINFSEGDVMLALGRQDVFNYIRDCAKELSNEETHHY